MDGTQVIKDSVEKKERKRGLLRELMEGQEEVRNLIEDLRKRPDKSMIEAIAGSADQDINLLIDLVLIRKEMLSEDREAELMDLIWAGEFLDHLDTLGRQIVKRNDG